MTLHAACTALRSSHFSRILARRKLNYDHLIAYTDRCCYMEKKRKADGIEAGKLDEEIAVIDEHSDRS